MDPMELNNQEDIYGQPGGEQQPEQPQTQDAAPVAAEPEAAAEPEDLAAYFRSLHNNDNAAAETNVADGGAAEGTPNGSQEQISGTTPNIPTGQPRGTGTAPVDLSGFDPNAKAREVYNDIRNLVVQQKRKEWDEKGYRKFSIRDLQRKDQSTGRIFYIDPDDRPEDWERPGYQGLKIQEAKAWVDIQNEALNEQWKKECGELEQQYVQQSAPYFNLIAYANTYSSLNPTEKMLVDRMTEPYALRNSNGEVIGFSCDLNMTTQIARQMAKDMGAINQAQPQQPATNNVRQPAVDARSSAGGSGRQQPALDVNNITNLQDAMRVVIAEDRARKAGR